MERSFDLGVRRDIVLVARVGPVWFGSSPAPIAGDPMKAVWFVATLAVALALAGCASNPFKKSGSMTAPTTAPARNPDPLLGGR